MRRIEKILGFIASAVFLLVGGAHAADPARPVDFNREIRPILSDNCFKCHGPDKQRSGLRFDAPEVPLEKKAIVPGDPAASNMIKRVTSSDPDFQMPPPDITPDTTLADLPLAARTAVFIIVQNALMLFCAPIVLRTARARRDKLESAR